MSTYGAETWLPHTVAAAGVSAAGGVDVVPPVEPPLVVPPDDVAPVPVVGAVTVPVRLTSTTFAAVPPGVPPKPTVADPPAGMRSFQATGLTTYRLPT